MKWNKIACLERFRDIAEALGEKVNHLNDDEAADKAIEAMTRICRYVDIPESLSAFDIPESALSEMAAEAIKQVRLLRNNPRALNVRDIEKFTVQPMAFKWRKQYEMEKPSLRR